LGVEELEHGSTRFFLDVHYHAGDWLRLMGMKNSWGDPSTGEYLLGNVLKGWEMGKAGLDWKWPETTGFEPASSPEKYTLTGDLGHLILPRQVEQSIRFGHFQLWMGAVEVWSADKTMRLGYGNLCLMTRN
jgi:hypothetical protein